MSSPSRPRVVKLTHRPPVVKLRTNVAHYHADRPEVVGAAPRHRSRRAREPCGPKPPPLRTAPTQSARLSERRPARRPRQILDHAARSRTAKNVMRIPPARGAGKTHVPTSPSAVAAATIFATPSLRGSRCFFLTMIVPPQHGLRRALTAIPRIVDDSVGG